MPLPLVPLVAALLGVTFALIGRDEVRRSTTAPSGTRGFLIVTLCAYALLAPSVGYFLAFYPDWAWSYLVAGSRVPSAVDLVATAVAVATAPLAYAWAASALRRHAVRALVRGAGLLVVLLAVALVALGPRLAVACTFRAFREGYELAPASATSLGVSILWIDGCLLAGLFWMATRLRTAERTRSSRGGRSSKLGG